MQRANHEIMSLEIIFGPQTLSHWLCLFLFFGCSGMSNFAPQRCSAVTFSLSPVRPTMMKTSEIMGQANISFFELVFSGIW